MSDGAGLLIKRRGVLVVVSAPSGAGKTTLISLLLRFYDIERGRILIDGQDIAGVAQHSLRQQIGVVTQDTSLLHRSVADNILYGRPDAPIEAVVAAARQAHAHEFIQGLVDPYGHTGYEAQVGERGVMSRPELPASATFPCGPVGAGRPGICLSSTPSCA